MSYNTKQDAILIFDLIGKPDWLRACQDRTNAVPVQHDDYITNAEWNDEIPETIRPLLYMWISKWYADVQPALRRHSWHLQPSSTNTAQLSNISQRQRYIEQYQNNSHVSIDESILLEFIELATIVFNGWSQSAKFAEHSQRLHRVINEWNHIATVRQYCVISSAGFELPLCIRRVKSWLTHLYESEDLATRDVVMQSSVQDMVISKVWTVPTPKCCRAVKPKARREISDNQATTEIGSSSSSAVQTLPQVQ